MSSGNDLIKVVAALILKTCKNVIGSMMSNYKALSRPAWLFLCCGFSLLISLNNANAVIPSYKCVDISKVDYIQKYGSILSLEGNQYRAPYKRYVIDMPDTQPNVRECFELAMMKRMTQTSTTQIQPPILSICGNTIGDFNATGTRVYLLSGITCISQQ